MKRDQLQLVEIDRALRVVRARVEHRLKQRGDGAFAGRHEAFGMITEEWMEAGEALRNDAEPGFFDDECIDIAVACVLAVASRRSTR